MGLPQPALLGKRVVFPANDGPHGVELWATDGTPHGTAMVKDVCPGACSGAPGFAAPLGNLLYFAGTDGIHGQEPWVSDGTAAGTRIIGDLCPGSCDSAPISFVPAGGRVYFLASDGKNGQQLWRSDATVQGTLSLTAGTDSFGFRPGLQGVSSGGSLVFAAHTPESGFELWGSDGTPQGTGLVADLNTMDAGGSYPSSLTAVGDTVEFFAQSHGEGGLWKSEGTEAGTTQVARLPPSRFIADPDLAELSGTRFFLVAVPEESSPSLWRADGTSNGTFRLSPEGVNVEGGLTVVGSLVFFVAADADHGNELWVTDGSAAGTHLVADLQPGSSDSSPGSLTAFQGRLYFTAMTLIDDHNVNRRELWQSDGTEAGTTLVKDTDRNSGKDPSSLNVHVGRLWFFALDGENISRFWSTDGTPAGTRPEAVRAGQGTVLSSPMIWDGSRVFFSVEEKLYVWNISLGSLDFLGDVEFARDGPFFKVGTVVNGILFFSGVDGSLIGNLWVSDGTKAGTRQLLDAAGRPVFYPHYIQAFAGRVVFTTNESLFQTDGTATGTVPLLSLFAPLEYTFHELVPVGTRLFFRNWDPVHGDELWALEAN